MNLNELNNTIDFLQKLKEEQEEKQLKILKANIEQEIFIKIKDTLFDFESEFIEKFMKENKVNTCYDFNCYQILDKIDDLIKVDVWKVD